MSLDLRHIDPQPLFSKLLSSTQSNSFRCPYKLEKMRPSILNGKEGTEISQESNMCLPFMIRSPKVKLDVLGVDFDKMKKQLKKINIDAKRNPPDEVKAMIFVRYHGFRIDSDVAESLEKYHKDKFKQIMLIILHRHEERAHHLHGKVQDPEKIPFSETETPNYKDYKMLKGIIHIHVGPQQENIFKNCDAGNQLKTWIKEIEDDDP